MSKNILLCGVGGQGIVLTSKLIASAAMEKGFSVMSSETIGMAQKGGSVFSFLRIGDDFHCPMFGKGSADLIIGYEPSEVVRMLPYLKNDGCVVVNAYPIMPVTSALADTNYNVDEMLDYIKANAKNVVVENGSEACIKLGSPRILNMVMLGLTIKTGVLPFTIEEIESTMKKIVKPQFHEINSSGLNYYN